MLSVSDFNDFEVFAVVAAEGSLSRAARRLLTSQPKVSQCVTRLEQNLGVKLMQRSTSGVTLTEAGQRLLPYLNSALHLMTEGISAVKDTSPAPSLRVCADPTLAPVVLPFVTRALQGIPVALSNRVMSTEDTTTAVLDGDAEVGFVHGDITSAHLVSQPLFADELCFVVHPEHPLASAGALEVADVIDYDVAIAMCAPGGEIAATHLTVAGIPPARLRRVTPAATAAMLSLYDEHVAACLHSSVNASLEGGMLTRLAIADLPDQRVEVTCLTRTGADGGQAMTTLRSEVARAWKRKALYA